ncbi:conserved hypothetical protein [Desulfonatronospira thiodismutans ASO3-1]|uniref:Uncharacterized protein n=1 Tax=Desulfonatronospira thiodismutans ASO3-1 TaxID=555779 RepID=D6SM48_9BACT|nr:conserved hypothetical protein [Desulfonatronospira thiodismutans ASO3-1]
MYVGNKFKRLNLTDPYRESRDRHSSNYYYED